jgi:hypothetical protein
MVPTKRLPSTNKASKRLKPHMVSGIVPVKRLLDSARPRSGDPDIPAGRPMTVGMGPVKSLRLKCKNSISIEKRQWLVDDELVRQLFEMERLATNKLTEGSIVCKPSVNSSVEMIAGKVHVLETRQVRVPGQCPTEMVGRYIERLQIGQKLEFSRQRTVQLAFLHRQVLQLVQSTNDIARNAS